MFARHDVPTARERRLHLFMHVVLLAFALSIELALIFAQRNGTGPLRVSPQVRLGWAHITHIALELPCFSTP